MNDITIILLSFFLGLSINIFVIFLMQKSVFANVNNKKKDPQDIHEGKKSRLGGISIFITFISLYLIYENQFKLNYIYFFLCLLPVFLSGLLEDLTKLISPMIRLFSTGFSSLMILYFFELTITRLGFDIVDIYFTSNIFVSYFLSFLSIILLTQAYNIIDGLNGLAIITNIFSVLTLIFISYELNEYEILRFCTIFILSSVGFLILNFPFGKIFLGDGGAYVLGFTLAFIVIYFAMNNLVISPLACFLIVIYPIHELTRSFLRRFISKEKKIMEPDTGHLHSLIYKYIIYKSRFEINKSNYIASVITLCIPFFNCCWAYAFYKSNNFLLIGIIIHFFLYELIYIFLKINEK